MNRFLHPRTPSKIQTYRYAHVYHWITLHAHSLMYALIQLLAHSLAGIFIRLPQVHSDSFAHTHFTHPDALFIDTHKNTTEGIQLIRVHGQISVTCI